MEYWNSTHWWAVSLKAKPIADKLLSLFSDLTKILTEKLS
jgi:hypothetical protein